MLFAHASRYRSRICKIMTTSKDEPNELETVAPRNKMGLLGAISYIIGNIVGAGIFITPTTILANTNSAASSNIQLYSAYMSSHIWLMAIAYPQFLFKKNIDYKIRIQIGLALCVWIGTGVIAMLGSFSYIELGTAIHESGCDFAYACYVKWYALAFCYMCVGCLVHYPAVVAIQAQTFSEYFLWAGYCRL
uniref:Uncharacterized protein n=1 Tax=Ditylenchus dipsaci TaxID=166011 RepID=A0A915ERK0_9BILA